MIYLDNNATTRPFPEVVTEMVRCLETDYGNPSSPHGFGRKAKACLDLARERLAGLAGVCPEQVVFTSGGTESNNLAGFGSLSALGDSPCTVAVSRVEHSSVYRIFDYLGKRGYKVIRIPVDRSGRVDPEWLKTELPAETRLVSVQLANSETGVVQPVEAIGDEVRKRNAVFHVDAVQAFGKISLPDMEENGISLMSVSGHKLHGPKGVGALLPARGVRVDPILQGGGQEFAKRPGTENLPAIAGFGKACEMLASDPLRYQNDLTVLRNRLEEGILVAVPSAVVNGDRVNRLPNTSNISFPGKESATLVARLDAMGIAVSAGSACQALAPGISPVLKAMRLDPELLAGAIRFSLGLFNRKEDINICLDAIRQLCG